MSKETLSALFDLTGRVAVVSGGTGILCGEMARALAGLGAKVAILGRSAEKAEGVLASIRDGGGEAIFAPCDVTSKTDLLEAHGAVTSALGPVDILINGAGGNSPKATTGGVTCADATAPSFFDLDAEAMRFVLDVNFHGAFLATQVFARDMVERASGSIVNISSMSASLPLTKVGAYSAAKAALENFTRWLAVHFAPANIRVNALSPGFFLTEQNRFLLTDRETGETTPRGETILSQTPMRRFGEPAELTGALVWLLGPSARFVTGITVPVDGGFSAFSGV